MDRLNKSAFSSILLNWYYNNGYDFPWRNVNDPYSIWISEVMLQQTRVSSALPYYKRWLLVFPDVRSVAVADLDIILKLWEGLGYYGRARNFHSACKLVQEKYRGVIPQDLISFGKLPGVGPYIAAAVLSIAFNIPIPAVDGNAVRVLSRINSIDLPYPKSKNIINSILINLIDPNDPGAFNQAIMDLGREICTAKNPSCSICPINKYCDSFVNNDVYKYPVKIKRRQRPHYNVAVGMIWKNNQILISKRKEHGLLGGLWEFPGGKIKIGESPTDCVIREVLEELNILVEPKAHVKQIAHTYTHFTITMDAYACRHRHGHPKALGCADFRWIFPDDIQLFAFPGANHKLFDKIKDSAV